MAKHIQLDENDIPALVEFYTKKRDNLKMQLSSVENILAQLQPSKYDAPVILPQTNPVQLNGYPIDNTWAERLEYILRKLGKATASKIVDEIMTYEPERKPKRKQLVPTISGILGAEASMSNGRFKRSLNDRKEYEYELNK